MKKILSLVAVLALVIPAAAIAERPADPGSKGKSQSQAKSKRCKGPNVGYTVRGTLAAAPDTSVADKVTLSVNVTSTSKHARALKTGTQPASITVPAAAYKYTGTAPATADAGDRVKIIGKIHKPKKKGCPAPTAEQLEAKIRKATVSEPEPAEETTQPAQPTA